MNNFKKAISFLDAENHRAIIDLEITDRNGYPEFTASGRYLGSSGQCLDNIKPRTTAQRTLIKIWEKWHLTNISGIIDFDKDLFAMIDKIEKEETAREAEKAKIEKTEDEKLLSQMEEYGIDDENIDACQAYLEIMNIDDLSNFWECYQGQYSNDEEFAREQADQLGLIDDKIGWPNNCIDWEQASSELMQDYTEQDGFYFRNL
jgi:hypothetical protein